MMGISAKNQHVMNFKNTLYGFKVLLGRKYSDPFVQNELKMLPFEVVESPNDKIGIKVRTKHILYPQPLHQTGIVILSLIIKYRKIAPPHPHAHAR